MNKQIIAVLFATLVLAGCVSQQSQNALAVLQAQCSAGDRNACTAAGYQMQANQQELRNNTAIAAGVDAALVGAAIVGAAVAGSQPSYRHSPAYRGYYRH